MEALHEGILNYVANFEGTEHLFGLVVFPTITEPNLNHVAVVTAPELTDVASFATALDQLGCSGPGIEPSYDAMQMITNSSDPLNISWRNDATPYVILITDEPGQSLLDNTEGSVALQTNICEIRNCMGEIL